MNNEEVTPLDLFMGANFGSIEMVRVACLSRLLGYTHVGWEVARNIPQLTDRMIFTKDLSEQTDILFIDSASMAIENAVSGLKFQQLFELSKDKKMPKILRTDISEKKLHGVAGAIAHSEYPKLEELIEIALWPGSEDFIRTVATDKAAGQIRDPVPSDLVIDPDFGIHINPERFRQLVFVVADDLPVFTFDVDPMSRDRALKVLSEAVLTYSRCGCFREVSAIATDGSVPEIVRATAALSLEKTASILFNRVEMNVLRISDELLLDLLAVSQSSWVSNEKKLMAMDILATHADRLAEEQYLHIVKGSIRPPTTSDSAVFLKAPAAPKFTTESSQELVSCPGGVQRFSREDGFNAFARLVREEVRKERVSRPPKATNSG